MKLTEQNVQQLLIEDSMKKAVFAYFYMEAPECAKCTQVLMGAIPENNEYLSLVEVNVQEQIGQAIAMQLGLQAVPAVIVLKQGQPAAVLQGEEQILAKLQETIQQFMPKESELLVNEAKELALSGDLATAIVKAQQAYTLEEKNLEYKFFLASLYIKNKNLNKAHELLDNPGREESESQDYKDLVSALTLAEQAAESPALKELEEKLKADPDNNELIVSYSAALAEAGKKEQALELLFGHLKQDIGNAELKKTFLDLLSTMSGDPLQKRYRGKLYALMY